MLLVGCKESVLADGPEIEGFTVSPKHLLLLICAVRVSLHSFPSA